LDHISSDDLERYHLRMIDSGDELAPLEQHLLACPLCVSQAEEAADYVDAMRAAMIAGARPS
jgi:hypothetical protein